MIKTMAFTGPRVLCDLPEETVVMSEATVANLTVWLLLSLTSFAFSSAPSSSFHSLVQPRLLQQLHTSFPPPLQRGLCILLICSTPFSFSRAPSVVLLIRYMWKAQELSTVWNKTFDLTLPCSFSVPWNPCRVSVSQIILPHRYDSFVLRNLPQRYSKELTSAVIHVFSSPLFEAWQSFQRPEFSYSSFCSDQPIKKQAGHQKLKTVISFPRKSPKKQVLSPVGHRPC